MVTMATIFETVKPRGTPPYKIGTGEEPPGSPMGSEQFSLASTFPEALEILFDLSDAGNFPHDQRILDAKGQEVFSLRNPEDLAQLKSLDPEAGGLT